MAARPRRVRVVDALPDIVEHLEPDQRELARRQLVADVVVARAGLWRPPPLVPEPGHLGLLVLDGLLSRDVILERPLATELVGQGDLVWPDDGDSDDAPIPFGVSWTVLQQAHLAVLDAAFTRVLGQWPAALEAIVRGAGKRAYYLAITMAVSNLRRVDVRVLVLLWYLADRWGRVTPEGIVLPLKLTHETLARLVGAQRPSVTTALRQLDEEGRVQRTADRSWLLRGDPPDTLARAQAAAGPDS